MSFVVVKTVEDGKVFLTTVPVSWCDGKTLYFPSSGNWKVLRKNKNPPEIDWKRYSCEVKGKYNTLEDALQAEKRFANFDDTDEEERYFWKLKEKRAHPARVLSDTNDSNNYNEILQELSEGRNSDATSSSSAGNFGGSEMDSSDNNMVDETLVEPSQGEKENLETLSEDLLVVNLPNVATSIEELRGDIIKLNAKVDKILDILVNRVSVVHNATFLNMPDPPETEEDINLFPIKSQEALNSLNEKLSDVTFLKSMTKQFSQEYIGAGYNWKKISYLLIDKLVERQVLTSFTWTGSSKKQSKFSFSALINFNRLFYGIVKAGDQSYTQLNHEDFFKHSILKYSEARATAAVRGLKRISTPRVCVTRKKSHISLEAPTEGLENKENEDFEETILELE